MHLAEIGLVDRVLVLGAAAWVVRGREPRHASLRTDRQCSEGVRDRELGAVDVLGADDDRLAYATLDIRPTVGAASLGRDFSSAAHRLVEQCGSLRTETSLLADVPLTELTSDELHARSAWAEVYLVRAHEPASTPGTIPDSVLHDHRKYLHRLESAGWLYAYGIVDDLPEDRVRELAILAAASAEDAGRIAMDDPLHRAGYRTNTVQNHIINEGVACYVARQMSRRARAEGAAPRLVPANQPTDAEDVDGEPGVELYLISLNPTDKLRSGDAARADHAHFVWLRENEMAARLMSCGPVGPAEPLGPGIWSGGLGVVATTRDEAERLAADEPSGRAGYRALTVRGWTVHHGIAAPIARALRALNALPTSTDDPLRD